MGLVRLKKSLRIVNHPPHPVGTDRSRRAMPAEPEKSRQKAPTVSLINNKHNSYRHFLLHLQQSFVNLHNE